jgi:DNA-binding Xre family transcriptional regulator
MAMCYKKLWKLLIDRDMTRADLREKTGLAPATLAKMTKGEAIGANVLERICETMQCDVGDIMSYVPDVSVQTNANNGVNRGGQDICQK